MRVSQRHQKQKKKQKQQSRRRQKGGSVTLPKFAPFTWPTNLGCSSTRQEIVTLHTGTIGDRIGPIGPYSDFIALYGEDIDGNPTPISYTDRSIALVGPEEIPYKNNSGETQNLRKNIYEKLLSEKTSGKSIKCLKL